ncbi:uncharacterized protein FIBRA_06984 [Fibroporia radiculosa]|uniref:Uncharacterized protein n=1 Tax=Fibroporia radiculosa TaxID=599839 RepID=J4IBJ9_9APHY|nr:uncharacterized protein FIBRA_06984 [Fibroporia radiculosa]CCM04791.1 predicted protein [Fibroporia radiculosa]
MPPSFSQGLIEQPASEVVADSEPEREELRRKEKDNKKRRKHKHFLSEPPVVIELTDSDDRPAPRDRPLTNNVIDLTDKKMNIAVPSAGNYRVYTRDRASKTPRTAVSFPVEPEVYSSETSWPSFRDILNKGLLNFGSPTDQHGPPSSSYQRDIDKLTECSGSDDTNAPSLNLKHFAYSRPPMVSRAVTSTASTSRSNSVVSTEQAKRPLKKAARVMIHPFTAEFSEIDLGALRKCICCELAWTARKTLAQKLKHIKSCAKRKALTDSTVTILIRDMLAASRIEKEASNCTTKKQDLPKTFLENVVQDDNTKRKGKRRQIVATVRHVTETRKDILGRARELISTSEASTSNRDVGTCTAVGELPPSTQTFGQSVLAKHHNFGSIVFPATQFSAPSKLAMAINVNPENDDLLPVTQVFAPSRLVSNEAETSLGNSLLHHPVDSALGAVFVHSSANELSPELPSSRNSTRAQFPRTSAETEIESHSLRTANDTDARPVDHYDDDITYDLDCHQDVWQNDDAYLHFVPEYLISRPSQANLAFTSLGTAATCLDSTQTPNLRSTPASSEPAKARKPRSKKKTHTTEECVQGDEREIAEAEFESRLQEAILKNHTLHLQVLRYEPVHFDVFLQIVADAGLAPSHRQGQLKLRTRRYLDKQAIHFFGAEPTKSRIRARHS